MKHEWFLRRVAWLMALILAYLPFHTFISTWLGALLGVPLVWKSLKDIVIFGILAGLVGWLMHRRQMAPQLRTPIHGLIITYAGLTVLSAVLAWQGAQTAAGLLMNLRYLAALSVMLVVARAWPFSHQRVLELLAWAGVVLGFFGIIQVLLPAEFLTLFGYGPTSVAPYVTIDQNSEWLRAFATLSGPNDYGAYLIISLVAALAIKRYWLAAPIGIGLFLSYSRSAWLGALVALGVLGLMKYEHNVVLKRRFLIGGIVALLLGGLTLIVAAEVPAVRLAVFHSSPGDSSLFEGSTMDHLIETTSGVWRVMAQPWGCGVGCSGPASFYGDDPKLSENYYVQIAEEVGVLGLALWLAIFALVMQGLWRQRRDELARVLFASGCGLAVIGLFLHVWADDPLSITWWALAGLAVAHMQKLSKVVKR